MKRMMITALALGAATPTDARLVAQESATQAVTRASETRLAVQRIVLYKHGIGYFERQGLVQGSAIVPLSFKASQMKDVLKSLFAIDLSGGRVTSILYDSKDPIEKQLEDILFRVPEGSALSQFMMQLKGARVRVTVGTREIVGSVLGVEPVQQQSQHGTITTYKLVLLREDGAVETAELFDASQITIEDEKIRRDLARMMDIYSKARYADRKVVNLRAEGNGQRELRVGYILETPIWKTSYRLLLGEDAPRLQGWAIVENRTDEDWNDVRLTFVAGSPMSFVMDLYTSYWPKRPVVGMEQVTPMPGGPSSPGPEMKTLALRRARADERAQRGADMPEAAAAPSFGELLDQTMQVAAEGSQLGELFQYTASAPVTIKQGQAALVPILFEKLEGSARVLYWRPDLAAQPAHSILLHNKTALTLEKGPVTVFEGAACLGEALMTRTLQPGMKDLLRYAVEPGVEITPRGQTQARPVTRATLENGVMTLHFSQVHEMTYELVNRTEKAHVVYIDHARAGGDFRLVEPQQADDELPGHYRFKVELPASGKAALTVREVQPVTTQVLLANTATDELRFYMQQEYLSAEAKGFLERLTKLMEDRNGVDRRLQQLEQERQQGLQDQDNLRKNIQVLRDSPQERALRDQYVARLTQSMQRIDEIDQQLQALRAGRADLEQQIARELRTFRG